MNLVKVILIGILCAWGYVEESIAIIIHSSIILLGDKDSMTAHEKIPSTSHPHSTKNKKEIQVTYF